MTENDHALRRLLLFIDFSAPISLWASLSPFLTSHILPFHLVVSDYFAALIFPRWRSGLDGIWWRLFGRDSTCYNVIDDVSGDGTLTFAE